MGRYKYGSSYCRSLTAATKEGRIQMEAIVTRLKEIDSAAVTILDHTAEEKRRLQEEWQQKTLEFDTNLSEQTKNSIEGQKARMESKIESELSKLSVDTEAQIRSLNEDYEKNKDKITGEIFFKVTGHKCRA